MPKSEPVDGVYCVWEWAAESGRGDARRWKLLKAAAVRGGRCEGMRADDWPLSQMAAGRDESEPEWFAGRCVTGWSMESGVFLAHFTPPEPAEWVEPFGWEWLTRQREWWRFVAGGVFLCGDTSDEAAKILRRGRGS